ncbi:hypothetical protein SOVF_012620 [Spinacia oleracea]|nr:hypothetical protein SOVF_012620 [Spinacia oleracea]
MAYVAPHKRLSKTQGGDPPPTPVLPNFEKSLSLNSSRSGSGKRMDKSTSHVKGIVYANGSISRWLAVPSMDVLQLPSSLSLVPATIDSPLLKSEDKMFTLVNGQSQAEHHGIKSCQLEKMWASVAETVHADLLSAFQNIRNEMVDQNPEEFKTAVVARFGKVVFRWKNPSHDLDFTKENSVSESYVKQQRRMFYTTVPVEYMDHIKIAAVPELGVHFEGEKELYYVKLADAKRPNSVVSCKCRIHKDEQKLELYKIELNPVRHVVIDMSCIAKNVDLRLALCTKKTLIALRDEEMEEIRSLISSAIFDPNVKGGLRWSLGKGKSGGQYNVVGVWHTKEDIFRNPFMKLKVRKADRYDFLTSTGEVTGEVVLRLIQIMNLLVQGSEAIDVLTMLEDALKLIEKHFLAWEGSLHSAVNQ